MPPDAVDVRTWCERAGLSGIREVRPIATGRSGSVVVSVRTSTGSMVVKVTADPGRVALARREVEVLRHLASHSVRLAPAVRGTAVTEEGVALALEEAAPLAEPGRLTSDDWRDVATAVAEVHRMPAPDSLGLQARPGGSPLPLVLEHGDCHVDNLVRDGSGRVLLVDWQEARLGDGLSDLVFAWQRGSSPARTRLERPWQRPTPRCVASTSPDLHRCSTVPSSGCSGRRGRRTSTSATTPVAQRSPSASLR